MLESLYHDGFHVLRRPGSEPGRRVHFAHATGFNATTYRALFEAIDARCEVLAMDARGHGLSTAEARPRKLKSWRGYERDLISFLEMLEGPSVLAGHSMGGMVGVQVAAIRPDLVSALVLVDPVMISPQFRLKATLIRASGLSKRIPIATAARRRRMDFASRDDAVDNYIGKGPFKTWPRSWIEAYVKGGTLETERGVTLSCHRDWESRTFSTATCDSFRFVRALKCPVTLVTAGKGSTCDTNCQDAFKAAHPDIRHIHLPEATHFIPMEQPDLVREEIERAVAATAR